MAAAIVLVAIGSGVYLVASTGAEHRRTAAQTLTTAGHPATTRAEPAAVTPVPTPPAASAAAQPAATSSSPRPAHSDALAIAFTDTDGFTFNISAEKLTQQTDLYSDGTTSAPPGSHYVAVEMTVANAQDDRNADLPVADIGMQVPGLGDGVNQVAVYDSETEDPVPVNDINLEPGDTHRYVLQTTTAVFDQDFSAGGFAIVLSDGSAASTLTTVLIAGQPTGGASVSQTCAAEIRRVGGSGLGRAASEIVAACPDYRLYARAYQAAEPNPISLDGPKNISPAFAIPFCDASSKPDTTADVYDSTLCSTARADEPDIFVKS